MRFLLVTATRLEMDAVKSGSPEKAGLDVQYLISGPGMMATAFSLGKHLSLQRPAIAIQFGIAGSYSDSFPAGCLVNVEKETLADFGAEDGDGFLTAFEAGIVRPDEIPFKQGQLWNPWLGAFSLPETLPLVNALTVNKVLGNEQSIQRMNDRFRPDIESMEGAAFFYACLLSDIPFLQIRAISNRVEKRNRNAWQVGPALGQISRYVRILFDCEPAAWCKFLQ
ncbi:MAG TPA: futalosine hydrolase [Bacteroidales bacterium]|nr:futalosine hydrolase [Bacteroidales bacterium]HSA42917.1 futalosine hydrolase [Bacteroidales bacterium]